MKNIKLILLWIFLLKGEAIDGKFLFNIFVVFFTNLLFTVVHKSVKKLNKSLSILNFTYLKAHILEIFRQYLKIHGALTVL